jgi:hypothetical protein
MLAGPFQQGSRRRRSRRNVYNIFNNTKF